MGGANILVNALAPGWVLTQKQLDLREDPISLASHLERQCLKEHPVRENIVGVLYLASDSNCMMTGQTMVVGGGVVVTG